MKVQARNFALKKIDQAIVTNESKKIINNHETDTQFVQNMLEIAEHANMVKKQVFAKRAHLTQRQYNWIQQIGDVHYKSNIFNQTSSQDLSEVPKQQKCICGCKRAYGQSLPFCINQQQQVFFGPGIILLFYYTKRICALIIAVTLIYGVYGVISNMVSNKQKSNCQKPGALAFMCDFKVQSSVEAKQGQNTLMLIQLILGLVVCMIWPVAIRMIRAVGRKKQKIIDKYLDSASDYTLFLQNLPAGQYSEIDILRHMKSQWDSIQNCQLGPLRIKAVQIVYKMGEVRQKIEKIQTLAQELKTYIKKNKKNKNNNKDDQDDQDNQDIQDDIDNQNNKYTNYTRYKDSKYNKYKDSKDSKYKDSKDNKYKDSKDSKYKDSKDSKFKDSKDKDNEMNQNSKDNQMNQNNKNNQMSKESGKKRKFYVIRKKFLAKYQQKKKKILKTYKQLSQFREKFLTDHQFRSKISSQCAVVQLTTQDQQRKFLDQFGTFRRTIIKDLIAKVKHLCSKKQQQALGGRSIKIYRAPQPSDIFYRHCENPISKRRILAVWLINFTLIGFSLGALILLAHIRNTNPHLGWFSIVGIITLNLFNRLIWNVLLNIIFIQENYTKTDNIISIMNKTFVTQTINLIVVPLVVNVGINGNVDGVGGLMGTIHDYQLTTFLFMTLFNFVNVPHRIVMFIQHVKCLRRLAIRYLCRVTGQLDTIQQMKDALTFLYDPPLVPLAGLYVYVTTVVSQAAFFCHLSPIILVYLIGSIMIFHLINRYLILRMSKITDMIDFLVFQTCVGFALNFPLLYGTGSIIFLYLRNDAPNFGYYVPSIICIIIWFLSVQSPFGLYRKIVDYLMNCIYEEEESNQSEEQKDKTYLKFIIDNLDKNRTQTTQQQQNKGVIHRKQNYYGANGTVQMFNYQSILQQAQGPYHNKNKQFCERFNLLQKQSQYQVLNGINMITIN